VTGLAGRAARAGTDLAALLMHVADAFALGDVASWSVLPTGYEDCNVDLTTAAARVVVKIFAPRRPAGIAARTAGLITAAQAVGVAHPRLHRDRDGAPAHSYHRHQVLVMDFVPGRTVYDRRRAPSRSELAGIVEQAVAIHTIDAHPEPVFDPWAISNMAPLARQVHDVLDTEQHRLVAHALDEIADIDPAVLPVTLIHADLTQGNVLIGEDGAVTVLDFAAANRLPRIQELAVVAANLTHGLPEPLPARVEAVAELYSAAAEVPLTSAERVGLHAFARAAAAMELLGALAEWHHHGDRGPETEYLIGLGMAGLRDYGLS
jgi:Ser/Thr protein kinase RdoA (MazF antagonist)